MSDTLTKIVEEINEEINQLRVKRLSKRLEDMKDIFRDCIKRRQSVLDIYINNSIPGMFNSFGEQKSGNILIYMQASEEGLTYINQVVCLTKVDNNHYKLDLSPYVSKLDQP